MYNTNWVNELYQENNLTSFIDFDEESFICRIIKKEKKIDSNSATECLRNVFLLKSI